MTNIQLPDSLPHRLVFYLAMEEYVAKETDIEDAFFLWQVAPTVIFGRNQSMEAEVNVGWCRENGVQIYRRKSGGGCVYSDAGNIMLSYITSGNDVQGIFGRYMAILASALRRLGVDAEVSGRNDILVGGRKVSGNAFYALSCRNIVHGTLLFDTDFGAMQAAITPSPGKLGAKGVSSVRHHVINLKECLGDSAVSLGVTSAEAMRSWLTKMLSTETYLLNDKEISKIEEIEATYLEPNFIAGHETVRACLKRSGRSEQDSVAVRKQFETCVRRARIEGAGEIKADVVLKGGLVDSVGISGDYFSLKESGRLNSDLSSLLKGVPLEKPAVAAALANFTAGDYVSGIGTMQLVDLLTASGVSGERLGNG